jgi:hypothetical protein
VIAARVAERGIDTVLDQPRQSDPCQIGRYEGKNAEDEKTAIAINEKLDTMIIAKNLSVL